MNFSQFQDQTQKSVLLKKKQIKHKWTKEEDEILHELVNQYGQDYKTIGSNMNEIFQSKDFEPRHCKARWALRNNPKINRGPLSVEEAQKLLHEVTRRILVAGHIWAKIEYLFENRPQVILYQGFRDIIRFILRRLNLFYGDSETQTHYQLRLNNIQGLTILLIVYFSQQPLQQFTFSHHLYLIVEATQKLYPFIKYFINLGYIYKEDVKYYFDKRPFKNLQKMSCEEFSNIIEPILLLDSLNRITFAQLPYDYGQNYEFMENESKKKLEKLKDDTLDQSYLDQNQEVLRPKMHEKFHAKYGKFANLSKEEVRAILNSDTAQAILPYQLKLYFRKKR